MINKSSFLDNDDSEFSKSFLTVNTEQLVFPKLSQTIILKETATSYTQTPIKPATIKFFQYPCIKCTKIMKFTKDLGNCYMDNNFLCNGCSRIENASIKGVLHCEDCFFDLCGNCRFCSKGHFLNKVFKLNIEGQPDEFKMYPKDSFKCDICKEFYKDFPFVYKCWPCGYDVCHKCILKSKGHIFE